MAGSHVALDWKGAAVLAAYDVAARKGVDETMSECVLAAQVAAPRRTGAMANNIKIVARAKVRGKTVSGFWGNDTQDYTIWVEIGARGRPGRYFLRRARDQEYPKLAERIRTWAKMKG